LPDGTPENVRSIRSCSTTKGEKRSTRSEKWICNPPMLDVSSLNPQLALFIKRFKTLLCLL